jgi:hypothetical protein
VRDMSKRQKRENPLSTLAEGRHSQRRSPLLRRLAALSLVDLDSHTKPKSATPYLDGVPADVLAGIHAFSKGELVWSCDFKLNVRLDPSTTLTLKSCHQQTRKVVFEKLKSHDLPPASLNPTGKPCTYPGDILSLLRGVSAGRASIDFFLGQLIKIGQVLKRYARIRQAVHSKLEAWPASDATSYELFSGPSRAWDLEIFDGQLVYPETWGLVAVYPPKWTVCASQAL